MQFLEIFSLREHTVHNGQEPDLQLVSVIAVNLPPLPLQQRETTELTGLTIMKVST